MTTRMRSVMAALFLVLGAGACSTQKTPLARSAQVPLADGNVKSKALSDGATRVIVKIEHLVPPSTLRPNATTYVVWAQPRMEPGDPVQPSPEALGALELDQNLTGRLDMVTRLIDFEVFVTAEPSAGVATPGGDRIAWAAVRRTAKR